MIANDPFAGLPEVPSFTVTSTTLTEGGHAHRSDVRDLRRPRRQGHLAAALVERRPRGTKSYAVTVYDPDAPTGSGFWHWAVADIPAT